MKRKEFIERMDWAIDGICDYPDRYTCRQIIFAFYPRDIAIGEDYCFLMDVKKSESSYWLNKRMGKYHLSAANRTLAPLRVDILTLFKHYALDEKLYLKY